jgi:hypothetical protein
VTHPSHPVSERKAAYFHGWLMLIGVAHVAAGVVAHTRLARISHTLGGMGMIWFHGIAAVKHWRDR